MGGVEGRVGDGASAVLLEVVERGQRYQSVVVRHGGSWASTLDTRRYER